MQNAHELSQPVWIVIHAAHGHVAHRVQGRRLVERRGAAGSPGRRGPRRAGRRAAARRSSPGARSEVVGPEDHVDVGARSSDALAIHLGEAAADGDLQARAALAQRLQVAQVPVEAVVGVLADAAGVEDDDVGVLERVRWDEPVAHEQPRDPLGVVLVHLAAVGPDGKGPRRGLHAGESTSGPARRPSAPTGASGGRLTWAAHAGGSRRRRSAAAHAGGRARERRRASVVTPIDATTTQQPPTSTPTPTCWPSAIHPTTNAIAGLRLKSTATLSRQPSQRGELEREADHDAEERHRPSRRRASGQVSDVHSRAASGREQHRQTHRASARPSTPRVTEPSRLEARCSTPIPPPRRARTARRASVTPPPGRASRTTPTSPSAANA